MSHRRKAKDAKKLKEMQQPPQEPSLTTTHINIPSGYDADFIREIWTKAGMIDIDTQMRLAKRMNERGVQDVAEVAYEYSLRGVNLFRLRICVGPDEHEFVSIQLNRLENCPRCGSLAKGNCFRDVFEMATELPMEGGRNWQVKFGYTANLDSSVANLHAWIQNDGIVFDPAFGFLMPLSAVKTFYIMETNSMSIEEFVRRMTDAQSYRSFVLSMGKMELRKKDGTWETP